jgi:hypothetical protein
MTTVPQSESIAAHGCDAVYGLLGENESARHRADVFAVAAACLERLGIYGEAAHQQLGEVMDGYDGPELAAAQRAAPDIENPWTAWDESTTEAKSHMEAWRAGLEQHRPTDTKPTGGVRFDAEAPQKPPAWLVPDLLAGGRVQMTSGAPGSGKSLLHESAMFASLLGEPFLGRSIPRLRWMVIDGENHIDDIAARWKALGLKDEHWDDIHLTDETAGVELGDPGWNEWLQREIEDFRPNVLVIDAVLSCCKLGLGNPEIVELYRETLKPLARRNRLAVWFMHHDRKSGGPGSSAALGGVSWEGQADLTYTSTRTRKLKRVERPDGTFETESRFALRYPKSGRGAFLTEDNVEYFEVRGVLEPDGSYRSLTVEHPSAAVSLEDRFLAAISDGPLGRGAIAETLNINVTGTPLRKAIEHLTERGEITQNSEKNYERPDAA